MDDLPRDELFLLLKERDALNAIQQEQIDSQQELISTQQEQLEKLAQDLKLLKRALFGHRRERFDDPLQQMLFESECVGGEDNDADDSSDDDESAAKKRRGGRRGRIVIPEAMPRKEVVHPLREEDIPEHLRGRDDLRVFRKKVGQYVELVEASGYVVEEYVEVLAADNADATETQMVQAPRPPRILNSYAGSSLLASLAVDRFADYLPYYRLEERIQRLGLKIPRSTIARWMIKLSQAVLPLVELMRSRAKKSEVICVDETPVKLLRPGESQAATSYLWTLVGDQQHPYNVYYFTENRSRAGPEQFLKDYSGVLVSDAYVCYESLQSEWTEQMSWACCHAHARRKFEEVHHLGATPQTTKALSYFQLLFDIEDEARDFTAEDRLALREKESRFVVGKLKAWMAEQLVGMRPKHVLRKPIEYMTKRWPSFTRFLESGAIPLENNAAERSVKLPVIAKKNHLFFASPGGGEAAMILYSFTSTCRRLHVDPSAYLNDVFKRLPTTPEDQLASLLPDHWLAEHPEHRLQLRADEAKQKARTVKKRRVQRRKQLQRKIRAN
jgi:transposase